MDVSSRQIKFKKGQDAEIYPMQEEKQKNVYKREKVGEGERAKDWRARKREGGREG